MTLQDAKNDKAVEEDKRAEDSDKLTRLHAAVTALGEAIFEWDLATDAILWSDCTPVVLGLPALEKVSTRSGLNALIEADDLARLQESFVDRYSSRDPFICEYRIRMPDGELCWLQERSTVVFNQFDEPVRVCGILQLVSRSQVDQASAVGEAPCEVLCDNVLDKYGRAALVDALRKSINHCRQGESSGGYLAVGIDQLMGNEAVTDGVAVKAIVSAVHQRLQNCLRATDVIDRVGSDRFGIVLTHCPEEDIPIVSETLLQSVRGVSVDGVGGPIDVTLSIGGAAFPDVAQTAHDAFAKADMALEKARRMGYNCYIPFHQAKTRRRSQRRNLAVLHEVQQAIQEDRLVFAFQPIVECKTNSVSYYECLLRLLRDDGSVVTAAKFVPVLEQLGYARLIDHYALDLALKELDAHPNVSLSINVSSLTATDPTWLSKFVLAMRDRPGIAKNLVVEITETALLQDIAESVRFVSTLRGLGCRVALDDFGSGFTSFHHLKALPVDILKIDGSFVMGMSKSHENQLLVKMLIDLAKGLNMNTVAECVERQEDVDVLYAQGVHQMQGYYFGRPELERPWLKESSVVPLSIMAAGKARA